MKLFNFIKNIIFLKRRHIFFLLTFLIYFLLIQKYLFLPSLGKHGWNESIYLTFLHSIIESNNPFFFYQAYDVARPDFNVGYIYFWAVYIFTKITKIFIFLPELFLFRIFSVISTFSTFIILFYFLNEFKLKHLSIFSVVFILIFSPLLVYYGWKVQLEPFLILLFLISQLFLIKYIKDENKLFLFYFSCLILGLLIPSRSNFIVFLPLYFIPLFFDFIKKEKNLKKILLTFFFIFFGILIVILPSLILYPEYNPLKFLYERIFGANKWASNPGRNIENIIYVFTNDALWKQLVILFPFSIFSWFIINKVIYSLKLKFYFLLLGIITLIFFLLVYPHASNHTFQTYYGLLWFSLASCVTFNFIENIIKQKYIIYLIISLFVFIHLFLSVYFIISFYGLFTDKIYDKIDAYGTYESYAVGQTLKYILEETNNNSGYILVQSPTVYYPSYRQSLTYHEVYSYDLEKNDYLFYNYFKNQSEFLSEIENRNIILMTITPDVFYTMSNEFLKYKNMNFVDICYTKNFVISMNETVFHNSPEIKINCINFLNNMTKNDNLANNTISNQWLESASILTKIEKNFENSLFIDKNFKEFNGLKLNKNNFTILLFLNSDNLVNNTDIVTLKDQINTNEKNNIWRVRFGGNNDIYLEIPKAMDGYSWMEGVYYYPQLNLPTCVVFMYSPNNYGTYINAVKKSETFFLLKNEERLKSIPSDLNFTQNQSLIIGSENFKGKIKTFIFNQTFSDTDIFNICLFPEEFNFSFTSEILDESYS